LGTTTTSRPLARVNSCASKMSARAACGAAKASAAPNKRPAALAAGLITIENTMILEETFQHALLLAHDGGRLALRHRLAERCILLQALLLGLWIDHGAVRLRIAPERQRVGERRRIGLVFGGLAVHQLADVGIDTAATGALQQRGFAGGLRG